MRADVLGVLLAGVGVLGARLRHRARERRRLEQPRGRGLLLLGTVLLFAFVLWELRAPAPLLPLRLFRDRSFTIANVVGLVFGFGVFGAIFILIQFMQIVQGLSPLEAGSGRCRGPWRRW